MRKCVQSTRAAPSVEPLKAAHLKGPLRIDYGDDDSELNDLIVEARQWAEEFLGRPLINQTVTEKFLTFGGDLELRWPAVSSITSVQYTDTNGDSQTLATSVYELGHHLGIGYVRLKYNQVWPSTRSHDDSVTVTYVAGYGAAATNIPKAILQALTLYIEYRYDGSTNEALLTTAKRLLGPYSVRR